MTHASSPLATVLVLDGMWFVFTVRLGKGIFFVYSRLVMEEMIGRSSARFVKVPSHTLAAEKQEVVAMLHQTMEPLTAGLIRVSPPGDMSSQGTAVAKPIVTETLDWSTIPLVPGTTITQLQVSLAYGPTAKASGIPVLGDSRWQPFVLLMDPVVAAIVRRIAPVNAWTLALPGATTVSYVMRTAFPGVLQRNIVPEDWRVDFIATPDSHQNIVLQDMTFLSGSWKPYGDYAPAGDVGGTRVFWADGGDSLGTTGAVVPGGQAWVVAVTLSIPAGFANLVVNSYNIEVRLHGGPTVSSSVVEVLGPAVLSGGPSVLVTLPRVNFSGYFSLWINFDSSMVNPTPVSVPQVVLGLNTISSYHHMSLSGMQNKGLVVDQVRVNGSSLLLSNVVNNVAKGGSVYAIQSDAEKPWYFWTQSLTHITSANTNLRVVQSWDKGLYTFVKPQGGRPLALEEAYLKDGNLLVTDTRHLPMFKPFGEKSYVVAVIVPPFLNPAAAVSLYPTAVTTFTVCRAIEFTSMDQFYNVEVSKVASAFFNDYADLVRGVPQFYENPLHLGAIGGILAGVAQKVVEWAPKVAKGIVTAGKVVLGMQRNVVREYPELAAVQKGKVKSSRRSSSRDSRASSRSRSRSNPRSALKTRDPVVLAGLSKAQRKRLRKKTRGRPPSG